MKTINKKGIRIYKGNPFKECELGREKMARRLTEIVKNVNADNGFVIGINSPWGTGKTTFIDMWKALLEKEEKNIICVKFKAWDNNFYNDPLVSILENLNEAIDKDIYKKIKPYIKSTTDTLVHDAIKAKSKELIDISRVKKEDELLKIYNNLKEKIKDIKVGLSELNQKLDKEGKLRVIFFIDELDRCRPNYAIEVLEIIKHFFSAKGFIFVLSLNKSQLLKSISTIYGKGIDSEGYLRRFIDIDYSLPMPSKEKYIESLIKKHKLTEEKDLTNMLFRALNDKKISLRDIEKLFFKLKIFIHFKTEINYSDLECFDDFDNDAYFNLGYCDSRYSDVEEENNKKIYKKRIISLLPFYYFLINFLDKELYNYILKNNITVLNVANEEIGERYKKSLKLFSFYENKELVEFSSAGNAIVDKINNILNYSDRKYCDTHIKIKSDNNLKELTLDLKSLFDKGEFIIKNDIEMINGIND